jgi:hypothetical protein
MCEQDPGEPSLLVNWMSMSVVDDGQKSRRQKKKRLQRGLRKPGRLSGTRWHFDLLVINECRSLSRGLIIKSIRETIV